MTLGHVYTHFTDHLVFFLTKYVPFRYQFSTPHSYKTIPIAAIVTVFTLYNTRVNNVTNIMCAKYKQCDGMTIRMTFVRVRKSVRLSDVVVTMAKRTF